MVGNGAALQYQGKGTTQYEQKAVLGFHMDFPKFCLYSHIHISFINWLNMDETIHLQMGLMSFFGRDYEFKMG
jgi:hypothetical protein